MQKISGFLFAGLLMTGVVTDLGCHSNPYPDSGLLVSTKPERHPAFGMEVPEVVEFQEGVSGKFTVKAYVPSGSPTVSFEGLPKDATYDATSGEVSWTPDFNAATDPQDPSVDEKVYTVTITLRDVQDPVQFTQRSIALVVKYTPRNFALQNFQGVSNLDEGQNFTEDFSVQDDDFPQGPFVIQAVGLPQGANLFQDASNAAVFHIKFSPDYGFVSSSNSGAKTVNWNLILINPRGRKLVTTAQWQVRGHRQNPQVYIPTNVNQGPPNVVFMVNAVDPNGETTPTITVDPVTLGTVTIVPVASAAAGTNPGVKPFNMVNVKWAGIPPTAAGTNVSLTVHSCVLNAFGQPTQCVTSIVPVYLNGGAP